MAFHRAEGVVTSFLSRLVFCSLVSCNPIVHNISFNVAFFLGAIRDSDSEECHCNIASLSRLPPVTLLFSSKRRKPFAAPPFLPLPLTPALFATQPSLTRYNREGLEQLVEEGFDGLDGLEGVPILSPLKGSGKEG